MILFLFCRFKATILWPILVLKEECVCAVLVYFQKKENYLVNHQLERI